MALKLSPPAVKWVPAMKRLVGRPFLLLGICSLLLVALIAWRVVAVWFDQPLPASSVAARILKVNSPGFKVITDRLASYRTGPENN